MAKVHDNATDLITFARSSSGTALRRVGYGDELVDNSGFDTDTSSWTALNSATLTNPAGNLDVENSAALTGYAYQAVTTKIGSVYKYSVDLTHSGDDGFIRVGTGSTVWTIYSSASLTTTGSYSTVFTATTTTTYIRVGNYDATSGHSTAWDNISVREINPLSVSIQMDGRMTYAGLNIRDEVTFVQWNNTSASERITIAMMTDSPNTGELEWQTYPNPDYGQINSASDAYTPGVLVPFNNSGRFGSTFVNGAVDGVAENADNTLTALPDLSNTNLEIAPDFMGTIGQFRQFAGDIGDAGLVTATNPSTEPTLSLTFDGTDGSFYNLNWSE